MRSNDFAGRWHRPMQPLSVLIADDHPLILVGLTTALTGLGLKVVGQVSAAGEVVERYAETRPDVLILDIRFEGDVTGLDVARELLKRFADARIVFYSQFDQDEIINEAYRIGGRAFVTKNTPATRLVEAIRAAHQDARPYFPPEIADRLALLKVRGDDSPQAKLEAREFEVFKLMARGLTNAEMAENMGLSVKTISTRPTMNSTMPAKLWMNPWPASSPKW